MVNMMKKRFTTPVSLTFSYKAALVVCAAVMAVAGSVSIVPSVYADKYDDQIRALQKEIDAFEAEARRLGSQAQTYQIEVSRLASEKAVIQGQIDLNQATFDKLVADIAENEKKIAANQEVLGDTIADLYVDDNISSVEMLASSENVGDYIDRQTQRSAVRDNLTTTIATIKELKKKLEEQRAETERILTEQKNARNALATKEAEQQELLNKTRGEEAAYQQLKSDRESKRAEVQRQQQAAIEAAQRRGGSFTVLPGDPNKGNYPWGGDGCYVDANLYSHGGVNGDGTDQLGYACRQCTSYAAWKVLEKTGRAYRYLGNANMWPDSSGVAYGRVPREKSVGVIMAGQYGHVVWIESVNGDGTVNVSQYNSYNMGGPGWGHYSEIRTSASTYDYYIYF